MIIRTTSTNVMPAGQRGCRLRAPRTACRGRCSRSISGTRRSIRRIRPGRSAAAAAASEGASRATANPPAKIANLLKKPLNGGTPAMAKRGHDEGEAEHRRAWRGCRAAAAACACRSCRRGEPATRKNRVLAKAWLKMCAIAALEGQVGAEHRQRQRQEDVGKLRDGRIGQQPLHVDLREVHDEAVDQRDGRHGGADPADDLRRADRPTSGRGRKCRRRP